MQSITPVTTDQLLQRGQESLAKFEIYVDTVWVNLCDLDGKNYLEDWSISLGGAGMSPKPIGGSFSVSLSNENSIFHPAHPTSSYTDYLKTGRKARLSIGAKYGGTDYYWQRIIGYMDEPKFDVTGYKVTITCADYMKPLQDTELKSPNNYWGSTKTFDSISSDGLSGSELYNEADAMDKESEANNVTNWSYTYCQFTSVADAGGGSTYVGKAYLDEEAPTYPEVKNTNIFTPADDTEYKLTFKYKIVTGNKPLSVLINQYTNGQYITLAEKTNMREHSYTEDCIYFKTQGTGNIEIRFKFYTLTQGDEFRIDEFSIKKFTPYYERYYQMPEACKGIHRVVLDDEDVWQGETDEGWYYEKDPGGAGGKVFFDINKEVSVGTDNLVIYYYTNQQIEDVLADLLVMAGLYANRAAALADMDYTDPAIDIDQAWFDEGDSVLEAVKLICERCDYRFYFKYDGKPSFKPKPSPGSIAFSFTSQGHIASAAIYQDRGEIWNRIIIEGLEQAEPVNLPWSKPSMFRGEASDSTSIDTYGERTKTIKNHLFQDQTSIDNMCSSLLAEYKDPKFYSNIGVPFNPAPLELGDKISWKERLDPSTEITESGILRDFKISKFDNSFICEIV